MLFGKVSFGLICRQVGVFLTRVSRSLGAADGGCGCTYWEWGGMPEINAKCLHDPEVT